MTNPNIPTPGGIESMPSGGVMATGEQGVGTFRMLTLRRGLKYEIDHPGMRMTRFPIVPALQRMGITTARSKRKAYADLERQMVEAGFEPLPLTK